MHMHGQRHSLYSDPVFRTDRTRRKLGDIPVTDFFGSVLRTRFVAGGYPLVGGAGGSAPAGEGAAARGAARGFAPTRPAAIAADGLAGGSAAVEETAAAGGAGGNCVFMPWQARIAGALLLAVLLAS